MAKHKKRNKIKLSIIIPFYGETAETLSLPLATINSQVGIDFEQVDVHLVNDGGEEIEFEKLSFFAHLDLHYHRLAENVGPGLARQYGVDQSEGEYIYFLDADDVLYSVDVLAHFFKTLKAGAAQLYLSQYYEEQRLADGSMTYALLDTFKKPTLYSVWLSRKYLLAIGLRFPVGLFVAEDSYFVGAALRLAEDIRPLNKVTYIRLYRKDSLMREKRHEMAEIVPTILRSIRLLCDFYASHRRDAQLTALIRLSLIGIYLKYQAYPPADKADFEKEMLQFRDHFAALWPSYSPELQKQLDEAKQNNEGGRYKRIDTSDFKEFLES
jgi:glycosyltransferase involved in cell wall biosynthesis